MDGAEPAPRDPPPAPQVKVWRSVAKAVSWRFVGTLDTLLLSYLLITYLGPEFGLTRGGRALETAGLIAGSEVVTKMVFYFLHERVWIKLDWGVVTRNGKRVQSYARTAVKTASWRAVASVDTTLLAWFWTGNLRTAMSIGGLEVFTKMILYFVHERVWVVVPFGVVARAD